jgi:ParB family chromosome partitioning protein
MAKTKAFSLSSTFSSATATIEQQEEIKKLRNEIEKLRVANKSSEEQLEKFRQELKRQSGEHLIPLEQMRPSAQPRQTFTQSAIRKRAESLRRQGQKNPIILVPILGEDNLFEIEDGELRYRGAQLLVNEGLEKWKCLKSVIAPPPQNAWELHKRSLIHHLHQEGLNPLDRIEAIVKEILTEISFQLTAQSVKDSKGDEQQAIRIQIQQSIRRLDYFFKRNQDEREKLLFWLESSQETQILEIQQLSLPEEIDRQILLVLLELQQNVCSLAANDLPMLLLPNDLKEAIRTQELPCHHAKAIAKLSSKILKISEDEIRKLRSQIVQKVILESLSLRETKEAVTRIISEQGASLEKAPQKKEFNQIKTILADISLPNLQKQELKSLKKTLTAKLAEIENLLTKGETKPLS